jgi:mannose-6-phosphate isomerase-like protein (cupin superfamily)
MPPGGGPPVMHRHDPGEVYFVLDGEFAFYVADPSGSVRRWTAASGAVVPLAGGTPHTIRNESGADAAAFVVHAPGAPMEGFLRAGAALAAGGDSGMDAVLAIAAQHGVELLGPIPDVSRSRP